MLARVVSLKELAWSTRFNCVVVTQGSSEEVRTQSVFPKALHPRLPLQGARIQSNAGHKLHDRGAPAGCKCRLLHTSRSAASPLCRVLAGISKKLKLLVTC